MANLLTIKQRFGIIGRSPLLDRALNTAVQVASTDLTVLITGESGVGKEVFSKIIHSLSPRKHSDFIAVNCGAIPAGTINSELFGHEKGAFTGATSDRKGYFETVDGGTIFLDEIGEMPLETQAYLLRILESGEFMRVGSTKVRKTDIRIVAATNVDLQDKINKGKFREDLFYRLNTVPIKVPALKERREDIYMLFRKFATDLAEKYRMESIKLDDKAQLLLENYRWPGNIRELKNLAEQVSVLAEDRNITADILIDYMPNITNRNLPIVTQKNGDSASFEEREILYKVLFDMKKDLTDLKKLVFGLISKNDLSVPDTSQLRQLNPPSFATEDYAASDSYSDKVQSDYFEEYRDKANIHNDFEETNNNYQPIIIDHKRKEEYDKADVVDESLSLADMEKEYILKALKKHKGRRKDAAADLGISERTLYRKIKEYEID
jgi:DNA-binding NtrC family response regulator